MVNRIQISNVPPELITGLKQQAAKFKFPSLKSYIIYQLEVSLQNKTLSEYDADTFQQVEQLNEKRERALVSFSNLNKENLRILKSQAEMNAMFDSVIELMELEQAGRI